jgi:hypothetical protein
MSLFIEIMYTLKPYLVNPAEHFDAYNDMRGLPEARNIFLSAEGRLETFSLNWLGQNPVEILHCITGNGYFEYYIVPVETARNFYIALVEMGYKEE